MKIKQRRPPLAASLLLALLVTTTPHLAVTTAFAASSPPAYELSPTFVLAGLDQKLTLKEYNAFYSFSFLPQTRAEAIAAGYLDETTRINFTHPRIQSIVASIEKTAKTDTDKLWAAYCYVIDHLSFSMAGKQPKASVALTRGYGTCDAYTVSLVSLLRAMGIPASYVIGSHTYGQLPAAGCTITEFLSIALNQNTHHGITLALIRDESGADSICLLDPVYADNKYEYYGTAEERRCYLISKGLGHPFLNQFAIGKIRPHADFGVTPVPYTAPAKFVRHGLTIDGQTIPGFKCVASQGQLYFSIEDFALVLAQHARDPRKTYTPTSSGVSAFYESSIIPTLPYTTASAAFDYSGDSLEARIYADYRLNTGSVQRLYTAVRLNGRYYLEHKAMLDIARTLDIHIETSQSATTIDTTRPFSEQLSPTYTLAKDMSLPLPHVSNYAILLK